MFFPRDKPVVVRGLTNAFTCSSRTIWPQQQLTPTSAHLTLLHDGTRCLIREINSFVFKSVLLHALLLIFAQTRHDAQEHILTQIGSQSNLQRFGTYATAHETRRRWQKRGFIVCRFGKILSKVLFLLLLLLTLFSIRVSPITRVEIKIQ